MRERKKILKLVKRTEGLEVAKNVSAQTLNSACSATYVKQTKG
jgi:hypothetical protein